MRGEFMLLMTMYPTYLTVISAARLRGLQDDLHLTGQEFPTLLSILYVGYILMQIPSYVVLSHPIPTTHSSALQQYVSELYWQTFFVPADMYDCVGYDLCPYW